MVGLTLLAEARAAGLEVRADGDRLVVRGHPTAEPLAERLLANKPLVLALLAAEKPEVVWRVVAMRPQANPKRALPILTSRGDLPEAPGMCVSCGAALSGERRYRCDPCRHAAWLTVYEIEEHEGDGR